MSDDDRVRLGELRERRQHALDAGRTMDPLLAGPEHRLLAEQVASELRALTDAAGELAALVASWQNLAGMCGLFDDLEAAERPSSDWRARIEQALAFVEEATA